MKVNILSALLVIGLFVFVLYLNSEKDETIDDISKKHEEVMKSKVRLSKIQDSLINALNELRVKSMEEVNKKDKELQSYKDSIKRITEITNNYVYSLDNNQLSIEYKTLIDAEDGVDVWDAGDDTSFVVDPINIRKTVTLLNEGGMYKNLYEVMDVAYDSALLTAKNLSIYKDIADSVIQVQKRELNLDSVLINEYKVHVEKIDKEHQKQLKKAKLKSFGIGAGVGAVGIALLLLL